VAGPPRLKSVEPLGLDSSMTKEVRMSASEYRPEELTRAEVEALPGPVVLDFGADWCGHCQAARPHVAAALGHFPGVRHVAIADGKGRPLGRSFGVKLWPTLVFLRDGQIVETLVRPGPGEIRRGFTAVAAERSTNGELS
jgi:thioredoxin 1